MEYAISPVHILIVDDDRVVLDFLRETVAPMFAEGRVETSASPRWALQRVRTESFHVVLSDIEMPDLNGLDLMRQVNARPPAPTVVLMTGDATWLPLAIEAGAYACLPKPVQLDLLGTVLRHAVDFNVLQQRVERSKQVLALQTRATNEYCEQVHARTQGIERRMAEMRQNELAQVSAAFGR